MAEQQPDQILKQRLARGEISLEQYRELQAAIGSVETIGVGTQAAHSPARGTTRLLASVDETEVYEAEIVHSGVSRPISSIVSVRGAVEKSSFNGMPASKNTWVIVIFEDGTHIKLVEGSTLRKKQRHADILSVLNAVRRQSFETRIDRLTEKIKRNGSALLEEKSWLNRNPVEIFADGTIGNSKRRYNIKAARANGTFKIGVARQAMTGSSSSSPYEIAISDRRTAGFLAVSPFHGIAFEPTAEDPDIVIALISWLSESDNHL